MRCNEARALCGPYLDSELDVKNSLDVEQHLGICPECARYFAAEKRMEERIATALQAGGETDSLWQKVEAEVSAPPASGGRGSRKWLQLAAVLVTVAALAFLWLREPKLDLVVAVAHDHAEFVAGELKPQFALRPSAEVLGQVKGRLDAAAFDALPSAPEFRLEGKRLCHLSGVPVAWALARIGQQPVSVIVLRRDEVNKFPQFRERLKSGHSVICSRSGRYQFAARIVGDHVVCAVAELPRTLLEELVRTVPNPG